MFGVILINYFMVYNKIILSISVNSQEWNGVLVKLSTVVHGF